MPSVPAFQTLTPLLWHPFKAPSVSYENVGMHIGNKTGKKENLKNISCRP